ncbi:MAG: ABC transporter ATP-binding protein [Proteobacteria bacterium]|nr:MAG: ABC transporter ATP-binding protein [Pseudomonadota bacterium]PIE40378.1 MAG: ABC transporter ATP-binding protein [Gammaproteobacteria bacterium]
MAEKKSIQITLKNISKHFGKVRIIDNLDIEFKAGTLTTLLGPSGCGKTTLLRMVSGLEAPTGGEIWFGDENVTKYSATHRDVGMVFQSYALFPHMRVEENVGYGLTILKKDKAFIKDAVSQALETVNLQGYQKRYPDELSGGQQQRVAVARALVLEPKVLLFDEPLSNIDSKLRRTMRDDIRRLQQKTGITSIYVTHDQGEALSVSDEVVVMRSGEIEQQGPPKDLYRNPKSAFVANFIGESNVVEATLDMTTGTPRVLLGDSSIDLGQRKVNAQPGKIKLSLRPEMFKLREEGDPKVDVPGKVAHNSYMGPVVEYLISTPIGELFTTVPVDEQQFDHGQSVYLHLRPEELIIIPSEKQ